MTRWLILVGLGLVACGATQAPPATPITVTTTAPTENQPAPAPTAAASSDAAGVTPPPEPQVHSGPTTVTGRLPPEGVQTKMGAHMPTFVACYKTELATSQNLAGTLRLKIIIDGQGKVSSATITAPSTLKDDALSRCVLKTVRSITFDKPAQGTVEVTYSLVFSP